jgi:hypothetical protein
MRREGERLRVYDRTAILTGTLAATVRVGGRPEQPLRARFTAVYVERNGGWRLVSWQTTRSE